MTEKVFGVTWVDGGYRAAVGIQGPKWARLVCFKSGGFVCIRRVKGHPDFMPATGYTAEKMARRFLKAGARRSSKAARKLLTQIKTK